MLGDRCLSLKECLDKSDGNRALKKRITQLETALKPYADPANWGQANPLFWYGPGHPGPSLAQEVLKENPV